MQKITPHLWFDKEAKEAVTFYTSIFPNSKILHINTIHDVPSPTGNCDIISYELCGKPFMAINAGPLFKFNPSISFFVNFDPSIDKHAMKNFDVLWEKLSDNGTVLMPLDEYPFSKHYGWIQDKYGLSWQLFLSSLKKDKRPAIAPSLLFVGDVVGRAEEAIQFYSSIFKNSIQGIVARYGNSHEPNHKDFIKYSDFTLNGQWFVAMDSPYKHEFAFNEAISFLIPCETQKEIDYFWEKLSADPNAEQCGWVKDKFGVSWQVWPTVLGDMMTQGTPEQVARVTKAFLVMKKFDIAALKQAYEDKN